MKKKQLAKIVVYSSLLAPTSFLFAQTFKSFATRIIELINAGSALLMALALLLFIVGVIRFISTAGDDKSRADGKQMMIWGTIALFVMVAVWGLVAIIRTTFLG